MLTLQTPAQITYLPYLDQLRQRHHLAGQQPDNLCGPYWVALLLQAFGDLPVSAVDVALAAATVVPSQGNPRDWLPPGATSRLGTNYDRIPTTADVHCSGTAIDGLIQATASLSAGHFCLVPLQTQAWETDLPTLWQLCQNHTEGPIVPLLNCHTSYLWGSRPSQTHVKAYLDGTPIHPSPPDWDVGHFALLAGYLQGNVNALYVVLDTYPHFGWGGLHLQPPDALCHSLVRPDHPTTGGIALFMATAVRSHLQPQLTDSGFQISPWDNGSPMPAPG